MRLDERVLTGKERTFGEEEIIVSKTDAKGHITYANRAFIEVAGYDEAELVGKPHNIIRHPSMPQIVFKRMWDTIASGHELFAYVVNRAKCGDHYWVLAHVTPSFDSAGAVVGYHSSRRTPDRRAVAVVEPLYRQLLETEQRFTDAREAMRASDQQLTAILAGKGWDEWVFSI